MAAGLMLCTSSRQAKEAAQAQLLCMRIWMRPDGARQLQH